MSRRYLEDEDDDPMLSMVNLIDVFLVVVVILFVLIVQNPLNHLAQDDVMVVKNPGKENMEIIVREGEKLTRYKSSGKIGSGEGTKAGVTYRMADGSLVYVPEAPEAKP